MRFLNELHEGDRINGIYLCKQKQSAVTKNGKPYENIILQDKTGVMDGKIWDPNSLGIDDFDALDYIDVVGDVTSFAGAMQLNIKRVRKAAEDEYNPADYLPVSENSTDDMYSQLKAFIDSVENVYLSALLKKLFVEDEEFIKAFEGHSAAKTVHHGFIGGLMEHTLGVTRLCDYMSKAYPVINRDLLITASLLHDIGKTKELSSFPLNDYTDEGQLLGHIYIGAQMIHDLASQIPEFPEVLKNELIHCILAHHGELEYGSPKKPALVEAVALNLADNTDARMETITEIFAADKGKKDWLGFGKRSRKSPAAASHPTGSWRVRENQMSGKVIIDKKENKGLFDLMNRQGLVENDIYKVFIAIIIAGINSFERYRQSIVRCIANKYNESKEEKKPKVIDNVIKNPEKLTELSSEEKKLFLDELEQMKKENRESKKQMDETERRYKYDIRLLNMLATSGLKATSIAHEMYNDRNSIDENVDYIIRALKRYELWDAVNEPENMKYMHRDVPALLEKNRRINRKIITFMDVMLSESEKEQFVPEDINVYELFKNIKFVWEKDYSWINIQLHIEEGLEYRSAKDIFRVIFDNLILNSIQQNDAENMLEIHIYVEKRGRYINMVYKDKGKGLSEKYKFDPMRILEVHETSRKKGHGIGMWIVNNTIANTGGKILKIEGLNGFKIEFMLGDKI